MTENKGDLISREALIKAVINNFDNLQAYFPKDFIEEIDNAPTVEPDILYLCDHKKCGDNFNCYECNHTSDIRHAINFDLMEFPRYVFVERKRPQGEWIYGEDDCGQDGWFCSECGFFVLWYYQYYEKDIDFIREYKACPHCLAEMVTYTGKDRDTKGGEEE